MKQQKSSFLLKFANTLFDVIVAIMQIYSLESIPTLRGEMWAL